MTDGGYGKYIVHREIPSEYPADYKAHLLEAARHEAGIRLYGLIYGVPNPVIIEITEEIAENQYGYGYMRPMDEIRITAKLTQVQRSFSYSAPSLMSSPVNMMWYPDPWWKKLPRRIKAAWRKLLSPAASRGKDGEE